MGPDDEAEEIESALPERTRARKAVVQYLYAVDVRNDPDLDPAAYLETKDLNDDNTAFGINLAEAVLEHRSEIDDVIEQYSENWQLDRMSVVDRNLLRMGITEINEFQDTPRAVVINECVELAKRMGSKKSNEFVNAILDRVD